MKPKAGIGCMSPVGTAPAPKASRPHTGKPLQSANYLSNLLKQAVGGQP